MIELSSDDERIRLRKIIIATKNDYVNLCSEKSKIFIAFCVRQTERFFLMPQEISIFVMQEAVPEVCFIAITVFVIGRCRCGVYFCSVFIVSKVDVMSRCTTLIFIRIDLV